MQNSICSHVCRLFLVGFAPYFRHLSRLMTKPTKWSVHPAKTQISLGIPSSLIRVFAECSVGSWGPNVSSCRQREWKSLFFLISLTLGDWMAVFEPEYNKVYNITCTPSEDSDQPVQPYSLVRVLAESSVGSQGSRLIRVDRKDWLGCTTNQSLLYTCVFVGFVMLTWDSAKRKDNFVGFVMRQLIYSQVCGCRCN